MYPEEINSVINDLNTLYPDLKYLDRLKTGKEAEVFLVETKGQLMALKIYKVRQKFSTRLAYIDMRNMKAREKKAISKHTNKGNNMTKKIWTQTEFESMDKFYKAGAFVPQPFASTQNALLIEYIGNENAAAPRLIDYKFHDKYEIFDLFDKTVFNLEIIIGYGFVHGDLSPYNILIWDSNPFIIDFPQLMTLYNNSKAYSVLRHDLQTLHNYFIKFLDKRVVDELWKFI